MIYDLADRRPASRFVYDVPQRVAWAKDGMRRRLMTDLANDVPAAVVVEHRDVFPMVTGDFLDSADMYGWGHNEQLLGKALKGGASASSCRPSSAR